MAIFDDDFLLNLPTDSLDAVYALLDRLDSVLVKISAGQAISDSDYEQLFEAYGLFIAFCESRDIQTSNLAMEDDLIRNVINLKNYISSLRREYAGKLRTRLENALTPDALQKGRDRFAALTGSLFCYTFEEADINAIQANLNELRDLISNASDLTEGHRRRLLKRIEQLQRELHKKVSDLDRFWGLVGDTGVVIRKLANDPKKVEKTLEIIRLITAIIWKTQTLAHGLPDSPPPVPMLPHSNL